MSNFIRDIRKYNTGVPLIVITIRVALSSNNDKHSGSIEYFIGMDSVMNIYCVCFCTLLILALSIFIRSIFIHP